MRMNKTSEAWNTSEYTKARLFAESMSKRSGNTRDVPADIIKKDQELTDQLSALKKQRLKAYEKNNKDQISALEPQVKQLEEQFTSHKKMLREKYPLFAATKYPEPLDLSQTALKDNEWALSYHVTNSGIIIYLTRGKNLAKTLFKPAERKDVDALVRKFREPMEITEGGITRQQLAKFDFASGKKLSDLLLSEILPDLPKDAPLIIIPDGSLGVVPFEMLVLNDAGKIVTNNNKMQTSGAEFFGDRNPISYYQSITALTLARTLGKQQKSGEKTLAMVDPIFSANDPRLIKVAKQERDRLLANLPTDITMSIQTENGLTFRRLPLTSQLGESLKKAEPQQIDLYEGMTAKKSVLLDKDLTGYGSLIFATHGYFGKDLPGIQEPVLVMTLLDQPKDQDGFLRLSEVMGLKINCDIAALTACQTGLGKVISGEGTMGMGRAFQYAGAKSVLMSLWSVSEEASVKLIEAFFKNLKEGKNKLEALKLSRDEIRKAGYDHPFFWAPFILVGEVDFDLSAPSHVTSLPKPTPISTASPVSDYEEHVIIFDASEEGVRVKLVRGKKVALTIYTKWKSEDLEKDVNKFRKPFDEAKLKEFDPELGKELYVKLLSKVSCRSSRRDTTNHYSRRRFVNFTVRGPCAVRQSRVEGRLVQRVS